LNLLRKTISRVIKRTQEKKSNKGALLALTSSLTVKVKEQGGQPPSLPPTTYN
jgi:hypothetical protein